MPVSDVDRAKAFYESLGWRLDIDIEPGEGVRIVQFTPPGSGCSISFGKGITPAEPGSFQGSELAVHDIDAAARGPDRPRHRGQRALPPRRRARAGPGPGASAPTRTFASFKDPDGNTWQLQEIKERLPGTVNQRNRKD